MPLPIQPKPPADHLSHEENKQLWNEQEEYMEKHTKQLQALPPGREKEEALLAAKRKDRIRCFAYNRSLCNRIDANLAEDDMRRKENTATVAPIVSTAVLVSQQGTKKVSPRDKKKQNVCTAVQKMNEHIQHENTLSNNGQSPSSLLKTIVFLLFSLAILHMVLDKFTTSCPCHKNRIHVKVCTEALCPGCKEFFLGQVLPTYHTLGDKVMDLHLVPFGNAIFHEKNKTATCQHGVGECDANTWEQCLIQVYPKPSDYLPMMECLENTLPMGSHPNVFDANIFEKCAQESQLAFPKIQYCHDNADIAARVLEQAAKQTPKDHKYVPWAIVDGIHMDEEHDNLLEVVCKAYVKKGGSHAGCNQTSSSSSGGSLLRGISTSAVV